MDLIAPWLIFPAVVALLCVGCGLLVERISGRPLPGALLAPLGFAVLVVVTQAAVVTGATAELALPAVAVLAVAGFALGFERLGGRRPDAWAIGIAAFTFVVF